MSRWQSLAIVHAEVHCNAQSTIETRSWFRASRFPKMWFLKLRFQYHSVYQRGVVSRISSVSMQKKSMLFSIIVTVSGCLSVFLDYWLIANCSCTKLMPPCCNNNSVSHWPHHPRIIRQINWRWFVVSEVISMIKNDVHFPSSKICSMYYNKNTLYKSSSLKIWLRTAVCMI